MVNVKKLFVAFVQLLLVASLVSASTIDLTGSSYDDAEVVIIEPVVLPDVDAVVRAGVYVNKYYFVFAYEDGGYKITPDKDRLIDIDFEIITSFPEFAEFLIRYPKMGDIEVMSYVHNKFGVPIDYLLDFKKLGVEE